MNLSCLFTIHYGQKIYHNKENLDLGESLLISSQATDNGCYGFYDIPPRFDPPIITVPSTGSIGFACVQLTLCSVADDALVLTPKEEMSTEYLFYVADFIRRMRWRFNYGRKITPTKLGKVAVKPPDEIRIKTSFEETYDRVYPHKTEIETHSTEKTEFREFKITDLFVVDRGDFHAIDKLERGDYPTVSRVSDDNGVVGFYKKPKKAEIYPPYIITISTVTGDAFLQVNPFIATDNVLICNPKKNYSLTTLLYVQAVLNKVKWRYSYGRQPYKRIFQKTTVSLPIDEEGSLNEAYIQEIVNRQPYFQAFLQKINHLNQPSTER